MAHLLGVCGLVLEDGGTEDEAIAALLHDAIEDHPRGGKTKDEIRKSFGVNVLAIVEACTDVVLEPKPSWRERKEQYVLRARHHSASARRVSIADKLNNVRWILGRLLRVGSAHWERSTPAPEDVRWYYRALVDVYRERGGAGGGALLAEFDRAVGELEEAVSGGGGP